MTSDHDLPLTFTAFRQANVTRCLRWHPDGIESWSPSDWLTAVAGELGELASLIKMRNRERDGLVGNKFSPTDKQIADELADVLTYLDLLAEALHVDLGKAAIDKFNAVSERCGFPDRIDNTAEAWNTRSAAVPVGALREFIRDRRVLNWDERADVANGVLRALEHLANQYDREAERREGS